MNDDEEVTTLLTSVHDFVNEDKQEFEEEEIQTLRKVADTTHKEDLRDNLSDLSATIRRWVRGSVLKAVEAHSDHFIQFCHDVDCICDTSKDSYEGHASYLFDTSTIEERELHLYHLPMVDDDSTFIKLAMVYSPSDRVIYIYHVVYESSFMNFDIALKTPCYV